MSIEITTEHDLLLYTVTSLLHLCVKLLNHISISYLKNKLFGKN
jgi:hypothetical protein